ncbi:OmpA family protein [Actinomadura viridis]|uniref:OmpA family protein n=1 Tax=Actinomadura viridis TaxID=58110 RepID=UPI00369B0531
MRIDLMALERVSDKVVVARMRAVNQDGTDVDFGSNFSGQIQAPPGQGAAPDPAAVSGMSLFDPVNSQRYFPLADTAGRCLCTRYQTFLKLPARQSLDLVAAFPAPPPSVGKLGLLVPNAAPFLDVPVSSRPTATITVEDGQSLDPTSVTTAPPQVVPVMALAENAAGVEEDTGVDLRIRLSSDVLFALNKADLSPQAQEALREVAAKIDRAADSTVNIDGHTDDSGNSAINKPLSERRAQSVQAALQKLVTRASVNYQSRGHGSSQPVASNTTPRGRELNRRVTVSFTRPRPEAASPTVSPSQSHKKTTLEAGKVAPVGYIGTWPRGSKVEVGSLRRVGQEYVTLSWTVLNNDSVPLRAHEIFNGLGLEEGYYGPGVNGVMLEVGKVRHRVLRDQRGNGLGSYFLTMRPQVTQLDQGESLVLTAMYKIPADILSVTVNFPGYGRAPSVPVQ